MSQEVVKVATRAKFTVAKVIHYAGGQSEVTLTAVIPKSGDTESENAKFWKYTPSGTLTMTIQTDHANEVFPVGQELYLDFITAGPKVT